MANTSKQAVQPGENNIYTLKPDAIILFPALGCSAVALPGDSFDIIVLLRSDTPPDSVKQRFFYINWDQKDSRNGQRLEVVSIRKLELGRDYLLENRLRLAEIVWQAWTAQEYTELYQIRLKSPAQGFYNIYYDQPQDLEDVLLHTILRSQPKSLDGDKDFAFLFNTDPTVSIRVDSHGKQQQGKKIRRYAPLFVAPDQYLSFALVGDPHTALNWNEFERRWREYRQSGKIARNQRDTCEFGKKLPQRMPLQKKYCDKDCAVCDDEKNFCNYNKMFLEVLDNIEKDTDVKALIIVGELIDCNRGFDDNQDIKDINHFAVNRNWLYFYQLIIDAIRKKPFFMITGNHDYRFNPYQPMPYLFGERYSIASDLNVTRRELCQIYDEEETVYDWGGIEDYAGKRSSLYMSYQSAHWYHLVINPFTDYTIRWGKMSLCFLDWNEGEANLPWDNRQLQFSDNLPWARDSLSESQISLLKFFKMDVPEGNFRALFAHAPLISPYKQIGYDYLKQGKIICGSCRGSGYTWQARHERVVPCPTCKGTRFQDALPWHRFWENEWELTDGTFYQKRNWLIRFVQDSGDSDDASGTVAAGPKRFHLIAGGHCHRSGLFQIFNEGGKSIVKMMRWNKGDRIDLEKPVYVTMNTAGPMPFQNDGGIAGDQGLRERTIDCPGYRKVIIDSSGKIISLEVISNQIKPRFIADYDFKRGFVEKYSTRSRPPFQPESGGDEVTDSIFPLSEAWELAKQFAPVVWLAPGEVYRPIEVDRVLKYAVLEEFGRIWNTKIKEGNITAGLMMQHNTSDHQLDISRPKMPPLVNELHAETAVYYRVVKSKKGGPSKYVIQYWFFYLDSIGEINLINSCTQHDGDWEFMQVILDENKRPESAGVSIHYYGEARLWAHVNTVEEGVPRPEIFIARGGHACHFVEGQIQTYDSMKNRFIRHSEFGNWSGSADDPTGWRGGRDNTGRGVRLEPAIDSKPSPRAYKLIDIQQKPWVEWKGHFGKSDWWTWGPRSPYYRSPEKDADKSLFSMWHYPLTWQKEFLKVEYRNP